VAEHSIGVHGREQQGAQRATEQSWTGRRKTQPTEFLLPATMRWMARLPSEFRPIATGRAFPRIANMLASLWGKPAEFSNYLDDLFIDKRGGRQGFPADALAELYALKAYYAISRPTSPTTQDAAKQPR